MTPRRLAAAVALAVLAVSATQCSSDDSPAAKGPPPTEPTTTTAVRVRPGRGPRPPRKTVLKARLTGRAVVPGPGAISGSGTATITLDPTAGQVCFELTVASVDPATSAEIFTGPAGAIGPATVTLDPPSGGKSAGCVAAPVGIIESIAANPPGFYVSIRNVQFPGGALRGQLQV